MPAAIGSPPSPAAAAREVCRRDGMPERRASPERIHAEAAVASGALLALAFPSHPDHPLAWLFAPLWGHLALVPLLCTLQGRGFKGGFANGWVAGTVWNLLCLYWVAHTQGGGPAVVAGTALMAAYLGLFPGLCSGLIAALGARWGHRALWLAPALWPGQE